MRIRAGGDQRMVVPTATDNNHHHLARGRLSNMSNPIVHVVLLLAVMATAWGQAKDSSHAEKDPHRPVCTSASCRKIKSFLKTHCYRSGKAA